MAVLLVIKECSQIAVTVRVDETTIAIHLIVLDLPLVHSTVVDHIPT